jgi:hypothetical protein
VFIAPHAGFADPPGAPRVDAIGFALDKTKDGQPHRQYSRGKQIKWNHDRVTEWQSVTDSLAEQFREHHFGRRFERYTCLHLLKDFDTV